MNNGSCFPNKNDQKDPLSYLSMMYNMISFFKNYEKKFERFGN